MRAFALSLIVILFSFISLGCGQKGPLYLPEKQNENQSEKSPQEQPNEKTE